MPPGPVEPETSSLWMDLFALDSVILIIVTCNCLPFSYSRSIFRRLISWQVLKIVLGNLQIWKFPGGGYPQTPLQGSWLLHSRKCPRYKKPATALLNLLSGRQVTFSKASTSLTANGFTSVERSLSLYRCIRYLYLIYCSIVYLMNPLVLAS